jgi:F-type H+-transporting ATPase subunit a
MEQNGHAIDPLHHFELHPLVELHLFGIDFSITQAVAWMWIAAAVLFVTLTLVAKTFKRYPRGVQTWVEMILEFLKKELVLDVIGEEGRPWFPLIATLFLFILTMNLLGMIPGSFTATSNINVTASLALLVFFIVQWVGIRTHGLIGYLKGFVPSGVPAWILPLLIPIEIISQLARPFSLAVRLFANMLAGHMVILVFLTMIILFKNLAIAILPVAGVVVMNAFEIFVALIQAYIFSVLTASYMAGAIHMEH